MALRIFKVTDITKHLRQEQLVRHLLRYNDIY